jgi:hypothetical protein
VTLILVLAAFCIGAGCDSGKKAVDEITGNRAVKQYHKSKKDIEKIVDRQAERHKSIPGDDRKDGEEKDQ